MAEPVRMGDREQKLSGWEEAGPAPAAWRISRDEVIIERTTSFFPDQRGGLYEQLLFGMPVMIQALDATGRISAVNQRWCRAMGYSQAEVMGLHFNDLLTPTSRAKLVQRIYPHYFQTDHCREEALTLRKKDGSSLEILLSMTAYRGAKGRIERSVCILEEEGRGNPASPPPAEPDRRFRSAFDAAAHGMALLSPTGDVIAANQALRDFLGITDAAAPTGPFDELLRGDDRERFLASMTRLLGGEIPILKEELRFITRAGGVAFGATNVSIVRNAKADIDHFLVQVIDLSGRRLAEQQLRQAQRMEAIGQLTGGLAHDFNNLLTVIIGNLQLIDMALKDHPKAHKRALEAIEAAQKGSGLTRQLLAFARRQALEPQEVNVNDLVRAMAPLVLRTIGETIQLKVVLMPGQPKTVIDPSQLESAILNLAINARDAMSAEGLLTIETHPVYLDQDYASANPEVSAGHYVMVAVTDTGKGIAPELLEKVFQPFFTTKPAGRGSGLGLSQVYGFIKQSGGHIQVYSETGHGTSIKMYLPRTLAPGEETAEAPLDRPEEPPQAASVPQADPPPRRTRILVVEDQEAVRQVACGFLTDFGYDVIEAENGADALGKLREHPDIDLMFSDVVMPGGMNGFELAKAAYSIRPDLKVVHTSGYPRGAMVHQEESRFREGFIIMKPYRREDLQNILKEALEQQ
ncbi:MAG: PAS domain S-box protein [Rhizobiales bacterium]|nr:PAS domain S-box protein [Hyphomicrobiales bacterium]